MKIRFLSSNALKIADAQAILRPIGVEVVPVTRRIAEIQTADITALVRDKAVKAFQLVGRPIIVEHTSLSLDRLNGFPGGLTQVFWDALQADRVCALFGAPEDDRVTARTHIGYCDGRTVRQFEGAICGRISPEPRGDRAFQWDCVFIPEGQTQTFAEMGSEQKNAISMRQLALRAFAAHLKRASP